MTVAELIEILRALPPELPVCVLNCASHQTTDEVEVAVESVYGTTSVVIAPPEEDE